MNIFQTTQFVIWFPKPKRTGKRLAWLAHMIALCPVSLRVKSVTVLGFVSVYDLKIIILKSKIWKHKFNNAAKRLVKSHVF